MVIEAINDFRSENGKGRIFSWNERENEFCVLHSLYMANNKISDHTPFCFLLHRAEILSVCDFMFNFRDTIRYMIFNLFGESPEHKEILLNSERLSYGVIVDNGKVYLTIRSY
jgi:uncharacterized protein YkwD